MALTVVAALGVGILVFTGVMALDRNRIRRYIAAQGGTVLAINWNPLGPGWFGEKDSNIYRVRYRDADGVVREARCKTGIFSGVYFTQETVIHRGQSRQQQAAREPGAASSSRPGYDELLAENTRLREENRRLRDQLEGR